MFLTGCVIVTFLDWYTCKAQTAEQLQKKKKLTANKQTTEYQSKLKSKHKGANGSSSECTASQSGSTP